MVEEFGNLSVVCVKTGNRYSSEYVNKLKYMTKRFIDRSHNFTCITDSFVGITNKEYMCVYCTTPEFDGWWNKLLIFKKDYIATKEYILYLDLDIVIVNDLDKMIEHCINSLKGKKIVTIRDWGSRVSINSSFMFFKKNTLNELYNTFKAEQEHFTQKYRKRGDQAYISDTLREKDIEFLPKEWIPSYKYSGNKPIKYLHNHRDAKIIVFHGSPKPHEVGHDWVKEYWQ